MVLNLKRKQETTAVISKIAENASSIVTASFSGVTASTMNKLRQLGRESGVRLRVVHNTLIRRVIEGTSFECLKKSLFGPTLVAFSYEHPGAGARLLRSFSQKNLGLEIKSAAFKGKLLSLSQIEVLASLPNREEAIKLLLLTIKEAAAGKLVRTLIQLCLKKEDNQTPVKAH